MFALVSNAIETVIPVSSLAYIAYAHAESDECGAMNDFLAAVRDASHAGAAFCRHSSQRAHPPVCARKPCSSRRGVVVAV